MAVPDFSDRGSNVVDLNRMLLKCGIPPVTTVTNLSNTSDVGLAMAHYANTGRALLNKGWWFNTIERYEVDAENGSVENVLDLADQQEFPWMRSEINTNILRVTPSPPMAGDCFGPSSVQYSSDRIYVFHKYKDFPPLVDIIERKDLIQCPEVFREYCSLKAAREFAPLMGLQLPMDDEEMAYEALLNAEAEYQNSRGHNVSHGHNTQRILRRRP